MIQGAGRIAETFHASLDSQIILSDVSVIEETRKTESGGNRVGHTMNLLLQAVLYSTKPVDFTASFRKGK